LTSAHTFAREYPFNAINQPLQWREFQSITEKILSFVLDNVWANTFMFIIEKSQTARGKLIPLFFEMREISLYGW